MNTPAGFTRVDNNATHMIQLPPIDNFPAGHRLIPGVNVVPTEYLKALRPFKVPFKGTDGKQGSRTLFEDLAQPSKASNGKAQVAILGNIAEDAEQGPPPPFDLSEYKEELAVKLVELTADKDALKRWSKDPRQSVATAAKLKIR